MSPRPVITKTYTSDKAFTKDAEKLYKQGYIPVSTNHQRGDIRLGASVVRMALLFGIFTGPARGRDKIMVTYRLSQPGTAPSFAT